MGACISLEPSDFTCRKLQCAYVITSTGQLRQYPVSVAVTVSEVLRSETSSPESFFLGNSDRLNFDEFIPALDMLEILQPSQIFFLLPKSKLRFRLAAADMADLAVKACVALQLINRRRRRSVAQISPVQAAKEEKQSQLSYLMNQSNIDSSVASKGKGRVSRSRSGRKLARYSSRGTKLEIRSFRIRLNTIDEESELLN